MFIDHCKAIHEGRNHGTKRKSFNNHEICFLFHLKSSFCSPVIQIFVIPFSPLFLPCQPLHKTMVEDKSRYFEKIIDTFRNKEDLILNVKNQKSKECRIGAPKTSRRSLGNSQNSQSMHEKFFKIRYFEIGLSKKF